VPQRKAGVKELKKNRRKKMHNLDIKTDLRKTIKSFLVSCESDNKQETQDNLKTVYKKLDKAAKRNILHKNTVSRRKSKFSKLATSKA
jgi:small subunit ribosomal protein S20